MRCERGEHRLPLASVAWQARGPPMVHPPPTSRACCSQMARTQKNKATSGHLGMLKVGGSSQPGH